jgi:hypothetical protein
MVEGGFSMWRKRPDGEPVANVPGYRQMMPFIMQSKNTSAIYFEFTVEMERALAMVEESREGGSLPITITHQILRAGAMTIQQYPRLNRFISGNRLYQRDGVWFSFSAKKAFDDKAPIVVIKMRVDPEDGLEKVARQVQEKLSQGRSETKSFTDKETDALLRLPRGLIQAFVKLQGALDFYNLLPPKMIENDVFYSTAFLANLGSIGLDAAYHHLYEYGNIPIFMTFGKVTLQPTLDGGERSMRPMARVCVTYDERVEDGFYAAKALGRFKHLMEHPEEML